MPLQLTAEIQDLLREARSAAMQRGHGELLPEHVLREMARQKDGARVLRALGLDLLRLVDELERFLGERAPLRRWWRPRAPEADGVLRRSIKFPSFLAGIDAVRRVAEHAEAKDHHPDIDIRWRTVTFALVTHSEGGITDKDVAMAHDIDGIIGD